MNNNHYVNHNRRILNAVAGEAHAQWEKEGHKHKLKKAKKEIMPLIGLRLNSFEQLKGI